MVGRGRVEGGTGRERNELTLIIVRAFSFGYLMEN